MSLTPQQRKSLGQSGQDNYNNNDNEQCMICSGTGRLRERICPNCAGHGTVAPGIYEDDNGLGTVNAGLIKRAAAAVEAREKTPWKQRSTTGTRKQWEDAISQLEYLVGEEGGAQDNYRHMLSLLKPLQQSGASEVIKTIMRQEERHQELLSKTLHDLIRKKPLE